MVLEQTSFKDGLDLISPDTDVSKMGYCWTVNARTRDGYCEPINAPVELTNAPAGLKQGIITLGNAVIMFVAGVAWYKLETASLWLKVSSFVPMDAAVQNIYSVAIPASSQDYVRKVNPDGNINSAVVKENQVKVNGTPSGVVVQDGINRPQLIRFSENTNVFSARPIKTFAQWSQSYPEYMPIGTLMMYTNQKLFIVSADKTKVYQSVTGQPLNFMVCIDANGDKLESEAIGGADTTSFAFDYDQITCLQPVNVTDSFLYATKNMTYVYTLDYSRTIFGEPLFSQAAKIESGIACQYSLAEISGDYAFVNPEGAKDFNAVQQLKWQGRNSIFSRGIARLLKNKRQSYAVAFGFDNYVMFDLNTVCGQLLAVYDSMSNQWVALDKFDIGQLIQVASVDLANEVRVYAITSTKVYQLYSLTAQKAQPYLYTRAYSPADASQFNLGASSSNSGDGPVTAIKSQTFDLIFKEGTTAGTVTVSEFKDGVFVKTLARPIEPAAAVTPWVPLPSIQPLIEPEGERVTFAFNNTERGFKLSYAITWNTDAVLMKTRLTTTDISIRVADKQKSGVLS